MLQHRRLLPPFAKSKFGYNFMFKRDNSVKSDKSKALRVVQKKYSAKKNLGCELITNIPGHQPNWKCLRNAMEMEKHIS